MRNTQSNNYALRITNYAFKLAHEVQVRGDNAAQDNAGGDDVAPRPAGAAGGFFFRCCGAEGQTLNLLVVRLFCRVRDCDHRDDADDKDKQAVVLEVDVVDNPPDRAFLEGRAQGGERVDAQTEQAESEAEN